MVPAGESRHSEHPAGICGSHSGHADESRTVVAASVQRTAGSVEHGAGSGEVDRCVRVEGKAPRPHKGRELRTREYARLNFWRCGFADSGNWTAYAVAGRDSTDQG